MLRDDRSASSTAAAGGRAGTTCTGGAPASPAAHVSPEPLVDTYAAELIALLGEAAYAELRRLAELRLDQGLIAPHPASPVPVELHRRRPGA